MSTLRAWSVERGVASARRLELPREHGFWVMLAAVQSSALLRSGVAPWSLAVAFAASLTIVLFAAAVHRQVRKSSLAQAASTVALALSGAPVEAAGGLAAHEISSGTTTWLVVFATSLLVVRAAFARSARDAGARAVAYQGSATVLALGGALVFALLDRTNESVACILATTLSAAFTVTRPNAKKLNVIGLSLAGLSLASALVLAW